MNLSDAYWEIKRSVVAFIPKYIPQIKPDQKFPMFPPIIGTGFIVRKDGLIATNKHVAVELAHQFTPKNTPEEEFLSEVLLIHWVRDGMFMVRLEIVGISMPTEFDGGKYYMGPSEGPDVAFVQVKCDELPTVKLDEAPKLLEGNIVGTAGYPMGDNMLIAPGYVHQLTPTFQQGAISAVLPFAGHPTPHAYALNIMIQGGASGSPVFSGESGEVIGIMYASLIDYSITESGKDSLAIPTNISYAIPSYYVATGLKYTESALPSDAMTIIELLEYKAKHEGVIDGFAGGAWKFKSRKGEDSNGSI